MSSFIDLTMDDNDSEMHASDAKGILTWPSIDLIPSSATDETIDHEELQACIERDILRPDLPLYNSGSGSLTSIESEGASKASHAHTANKCVLASSSARVTVYANDGDEDLQILDAEPRSFPQRPLKRPRFDADFTMPALSKLLLNNDQEIIELEEDEAAEEAEEHENEAAIEFLFGPAVDEQDDNFSEIVDLSLDDDDKDDGTTQPHGVRPKPRLQSRLERRQFSSNIAVERIGFDVISSVKQGDNIYKPGDGIEFYNGTFMRIKLLRRNTTGKIILSGPLLTRPPHHCLDTKIWRKTGLLPNRTNEVIWTVTIDGRERQDQEAVDRELTDVMRPRKIVFTNQTWPCNSCSNRPGKKGHVINHGPLYCRWKRIKQVQSRTANREQEYEDCIVRLAESEADPGDTRITAWKLRRAARGRHVPPEGGSATRSRQFTSETGSILTEKITQYTFADCFCGCGGASKGAELADCVIRWAVDFDEEAVRSYLANFRTTTCYQEHISDFLHRLREDPDTAASHMVDILHMSPPCQAFSLARTTGSVHARETIEAVITSTGEILKYVKPRIATMEEAPGLLYAHKDWLSLAIREIIDRGYSLRWKVMRSEQYQVPQIRKRLVIIAAGPGETMPAWPKPTHGPGLRPLASINDAIRHIPKNATHQQIISQFKDGRLQDAFNGETQARTVTCSGGIGNYHPSGLRPYTVREWACLQTFPVLHSFANANLTTAKRQIGNAFPPLMARAVYKEVVKTLKEADRVERRRKEGRDE